MSKLTYRIVCNGSSRSNVVAKQIAAILKPHFVLAPNKVPADYLLVLGGDGTFIRYAVENNYAQTKIVGINTGNLGFYTSFCTNELAQLPAFLKRTKFQPINLLDIGYNNQHFTGLNELSITSSTAYPLDITFDGCFYEQFRGTGVLIASRTGSTGYAKSAGGAVAFPGVECLEFIELYPLLHVGFITVQSPLALPPTTQVQITPVPPVGFTGTHPQVHLDGRLVTKTFSSGQLMVTTKKSLAQFCLPNTLAAFVSKLKQTFIVDQKRN